MSRKRVFVYVQHLLGIGHLVRAATLARALAAAGLEVVLASGGLRVPGLSTAGAHLVQLPAAAAADLQFSGLVDEAGKPVDENWRRHRREALHAAWRAFKPHALVLELFPFGRRQMRFELLPLLEAAGASMPRPVVVSSVRDVLGGGQRDPSRQDEMLELFERHFDHLLVHGDEAFLAFDKTFRHAERIADRLHYTGYVVEGGESGLAGVDTGSNEVIVSAGGGAVGARLLETAILARPLTTLAGRCWRVLTGVNIDAAAFHALTALAAEAGEGRVLVERSRRDFTSLLANCALSVSQAGYNTIMEILNAGARAVAVPYAGGGETEQPLRARLLAERGRIELIEEAALSPQALAGAVDRAARKPPPGRDGIDLGGAPRSAALIAQWTQELAW